MRLQMECEVVLEDLEIEVAQGFSGCLALKPGGWKRWIMRNGAEMTPGEKEIELRH